MYSRRQDHGREPVLAGARLQGWGRGGGRGEHSLRRGGGRGRRDGTGLDNRPARPNRTAGHRPRPLGIGCGLRAGRGEHPGPGDPDKPRRRLASPEHEFLLAVSYQQPAGRTPKELMADLSERSWFLWKKSNEISCYTPRRLGWIVGVCAWRALQA